MATVLKTLTINEYSPVNVLIDIAVNVDVDVDLTSLL
jgi:hypothetical protein